MLGAPRPESIHVDAQINASASMGNNGLVLTIGLPLVAGLNMNQFVGILSHEIGHFTQHEGMQSLQFVSKFQRWVSGLFEGTDVLSQILWTACRVSVIFLPLALGWFVGRILLVLLMAHGYDLCRAAVAANGV